MAAVWFAPTIVAHSGLRQHVIPFLLPEFEGTCHFGSAHLGWLSPVVLSDVMVFDKRQQSFLTVRTVVCERDLIDLILHPERIGRVRVEQPQLKLILRADGSNVEDALQSLLSDDGSPSAQYEYTVEVAGGSVDISDDRSEHNRVLKDVSLTLCQPAQPRLLVISAAISLDGNSSAKLEMRLQLPAVDQTVPAADRGEMTIDSQHWPLDSLASLLLRLQTDARISGISSGKLKVTWDAVHPSAGYTIGGQIDISNLDLDAPDYLGADRLQLASLIASGELKYSGDRFELADVEIESDVGRFSGSGTVKASGLSNNQTATALQAILGDEDYRLGGEIDLARLAKLFPQAMNIRADSAVTAGRATLELVSRLDKSERQWLGRVRAADLTVLSGEREFHWEKPIEIDLAAHRASGRPIIDRLDCRSSFLQLSGEGSSDEFSFNANCSLQQLASELGRLINLGELRLAGQLAVSGKGNWTDDRLQLAAHARATDFEWASPERQVWKEKQLDISAEADVAFAAGAVKRLNAGKFKVVSGQDLLDVVVQEAVNLSEVSGAPLDLDVSGELRTWLQRLGPWFRPEGWDLSGSFNANLRGGFSKEQIIVEAARVDMKNLQVRGEGVSINEPAVSIELDAGWEGKSSRATVRSLVLRSHTLSARVGDFTMQTDETESAVLNGVLAVSADVDRFEQWFRNPDAPAASHLTGMASAQFRFARNGDTTDLTWQVDSEKLALVSPPDTNASIPAGTTPRWQTVFEDGPFSFNGTGRYDRRSETWLIERSRFSAPALQLQTHGVVSDLGDVARVDLAGELNYDLDQLTSRFRGELGEHIHAGGRQSRPFTLTGPLFASTAAGQGQSTPAWNWSRELAARASFGWNSANVYGMTAGPGALLLQLETGVLAMSPVDLVVSEGRLKLGSRILLDRSPQLVVFDAGSAVEQIRFSPEQCETWLRFVAPLLADATRIDGRFSANLKSGSMPLFSPRSGDVDGVLRVHSAQVLPGPLAQQMIGVIEQIENIVKKRPPAAIEKRTDSLLVMPEQDVPVRMVEGRVYHQSLQFTVKDVSLRTSGSVGFDESLSLAADVAIPDRWIGNDPVLAGLKGQTVRIPITGTLNRPQIDGRVLNELVRKVAGSAANTLIEKELGKQLDRLFGPKK